MRLKPHGFFLHMEKPTLQMLLEANALLMAKQSRLKSYGRNCPLDYAHQRALLRDLMNMYQPLSLPDPRYFELQDAILSYENAQQKTVELKDLKSSPLNDGIYHYQGDITGLKVDAIVNAANSSLLGCFIPRHFCIDNCIHSKSGLQLRFRCKEIGHIKTSEAVITEAYNLKCRYIIHAVGPMVLFELNDSLRQSLAKTYENILAQAAAYKLKSIAVCCISTGAFRFPNDEAAEIAAATVLNTLKAKKLSLKVVFNTYKDADAQLYQKLLF